MALARPAPKGKAMPLVAEKETDVTLLPASSSSAAAMPAPAGPVPSKYRVSSFRKRMNSTEAGRATLMARAREDSRRFRANSKKRVQTLRDEVASYEDKLHGMGINLPPVDDDNEDKNVSGKDRAKFSNLYLPPPEELALMSKEELSAWKAKQRRERNRLRKAEESARRKRLVQCLEERLNNLKGICLLVEAILGKDDGVTTPHKDLEDDGDNAFDRDTMLGDMEGATGSLPAIKEEGGNGFDTDMEISSQPNLVEDWVASLYTEAAVSTDTVLVSAGAKESPK